MKIHVVVQTCPERRELLPHVLDSVRASDIDDFEVMEHPEGMPLQDFFLSVMRRLRDSGADYGIRMEDDVIVGKHILHNVRTWPALKEDDFGAGWLFASQGMIGDQMSLRLSKKYRQTYRPTKEIHCALAVLLPVDLLGDQLYPRMEQAPIPQDFAMSRSVYSSGMRCYLHWPPLVENMMVPSTRGHVHNKIGHSANGHFDPDFKRRCTPRASI